MWSVYIRNKVLDKILKGTDFSISIYVSLHDDDPGATGADEVAGGSYARTLVGPSGWDAASGGQSETAAAITFTDLPTVTVSHWGAFDAPSGGNFILGGELDNPVSVTAGDGFALPIGALAALEAGSI